MTFQEIHGAAMAADDAYEAALRAEGFKSRWDRKAGQGSEALQRALSLKIDADTALHQAFEYERAKARKNVNI